MGGGHSQEPQARRGPGRDWVLEPRESSDWERVPTGDVVFLGPLLQSTQVSLQAQRPAGTCRAGAKCPAQDLTIGDQFKQQQIN